MLDSGVLGLGLYLDALSILSKRRFSMLLLLTEGIVI